MIAFKVRLNYQQLAIAGATDMSVMSTHVTALGLGRGAHVDLHVGGLTQSREGEEGDHVDWVRSRRLNVGDFVSIEIVDTDEFSPVVQRRPSQREEPVAEGDDVILLSRGEMFLLLGAKSPKGLDQIAAEEENAYYVSKLTKLGLLAASEGRLTATDLGREVLDNSSSRMELVFRSRVRKE